MTDLFEPMLLGDVRIANRIVMAPLTRSRAGPGEVPSTLAPEYYAQRASVGLIVSEATQISRQGQGYPNTPGIFTDAQVEGWRAVTDAVHAGGGRIFAQLWHVGRVSITDYQPDGGPAVGPSAIAAEGQAMKPDFSFTPFQTPRELSVAEIAGVVGDYARAAERAREAGFDGVEIHGANGYLIDQFLRDGSNRRTDAYGGAIENRARFLLEVTEAVVGVLGAGRVGLRLSPTGTSNGMSDSDPQALSLHVARALRPYGLAYLHLIEPGEGHPMAAPAGAPRLAEALREAFGGPLMLNGGLTRETAEQALNERRADLVSVGVGVLANPDLVERWRTGAELNAPDRATFYGGGAAGYTDYPRLAQAVQKTNVAA
jgi:N-ethylmaleimide reductase